jgi:hypothetical protein
LNGVLSNYNCLRKDWRFQRFHYFDVCERTDLTKIDMVLQTMQLAGQRRLAKSDVSAAILAILLALGASRREAAKVVRQLTDGAASADDAGSSKTKKSTGR